MSNWLSNLFGKRKDGEGQTTNDEAEEESIQNNNKLQSAIPNPQYDGDPDNEPVSPLAMMSEKSPEAWLGQFLTILGAPPALQFTSIGAAQRDGRLADHLRGIVEGATDNPARLFEPGYADGLKARDWAAWWRATEALGRYSYAVLSLEMLGDRTHNADLVLMYRQEANSRIQKHAHYVICQVLGKDWPTYRVTENDLARLSAS